MARTDAGGAAHASLRGAAVALSPVLGVPVGSISRRCTSSCATGRCSTPFGTTYISPGPSVTVRSRSSISSLPLRTRKKSSVSSCLCQTKLAPELDDHDVIIVELRHRSRRPVVLEGGELLCQ